MEEIRRVERTMLETMRMERERIDQQNSNMEAALAILLRRQRLQQLQHQQEQQQQEQQQQE